MLARVLSLAFLAVSLDALATDIYKCTGGGVTSYQETPCPRGQSEVALRRPGASLQGTAAPVPRGAPPPTRKVWTRTSVEVGMSDDEVLNLPGWGRPAEILRTRLARGWQEVWRYDGGYSYSGARELRFVNARLADIADAPAALAWAPR
jgi:hypothetical protein